MSDRGAAGFWSYAHGDNEDDGGGVLALAAAVRKEYSLITGEGLSLFVDRDSIAWGDEWRARIGDALRDTTFLIPIVTPRYFTRDECRGELLDFWRQAESLSLPKLVMPILFVAVEDLTEKNPDEAIALVARRQYYDWTKLRLAARDSSEYRTAVNDIARRLAAVAAEVIEIQLAQEAVTVESSEPPALGDLLDALTPLLGPWSEAVAEAQIIDAQWSATAKAYDAQLNRQAGSVPASARLGTIQRMAKALQSIASSTMETARVYSAKTIEMDPLVTSLARIVDLHPQHEDMVSELRVAVHECADEIQRSEVKAAQPSSLIAYEWADSFAHVSQGMRQVAKIYREETAIIKEANAIVLRWEDTLNSLGRASSDDEAI